ncbi:MAG: TetR/AcrR family transcriptional regulator [Rhodospirillales bacterium]|nr:TetR/AcrR family transcriptional regulator [Alphaproteobacteria bacterium]MCB9987150.1 TetR/AcrR family transcriptional regulator [Rhodospirillales bacterium]USO08093.1 MAG: TetR/AcrR family transcriptional regulator [Rhodospirillales bacterium]
MSNPDYQAARARKSREKILNAALGLFVERGFDTVGLKDIARAARVSTATVFKHYPQKEQLLTGAVALLAEMRDETHATPAEPVLAALRAIGLSYARRLDNPMLLGLIRLGILLKESAPGLGQAVNDAWRRPFIARLEALLDRGIDDGHWRITDRGVATRQFYGLITDALLWPRLFGLSASTPAPYREMVVDEAVKTFSMRYAIN